MHRVKLFKLCAGKVRRLEQLNSTLLIAAPLKIKVHRLARIVVYAKRDVVSNARFLHVPGLVNLPVLQVSVYPENGKWLLDEMSVMKMLQSCKC